MGAKPEARFRSQLCAELRKCGAKAQAIESEGTGQGIPDVYVVHDGMALWLECKQIPVPWPNERKVPFRPFQFAWLRENRRKGGHSFVAVRMENGYVFASVDDVDTATVRIDPWPSLFLEVLDGKKVLSWLHDKGRVC
jgi:Holliday junction resolvase